MASIKSRVYMTPAPWRSAFRRIAQRVCSADGAYLGDIKVNSAGRFVGPHRLFSHASVGDELLLKAVDDGISVELLSRAAH
jgi:hypothetical protein